MHNTPTQKKRKIIPGFAIGDGLFKWICDNIRKEGVIIELGSGEGSHKLANEGFLMVCIEHDPLWCGVYDNIEYHYHPLKNGWYDLITMPYHGECDLLLIDGPPGQGRSKILEYVKDLHLAETIIVDDTHREEEMYLAKELSKITGRKMVTIKDGSKRFSII